MSRVDLSQFNDKELSQILALMDLAKSGGGTEEQVKAIGMEKETALRFKTVLDDRRKRNIDSPKAS